MSAEVKLPRSFMGPYHLKHDVNSDESDGREVKGRKVVRPISSRLRRHEHVRVRSPLERTPVSADSESMLCSLPRVYIISPPSSADLLGDSPLNSMRYQRISGKKCLGGDTFSDASRDPARGVR